jgi:hypothetical protein
VLVVKGHLDAPVEGRAGDRGVREPALDEAADLVHAEVRLHEVGVLVIEREEPVLEGGELEEVGLLLDALERAAAVRAEVLTLGAALLVCLLDLGLGEVGLLRHAVPAVVGALVEVAALQHAVPQVLDRVVLAGLGGADEVVVGDLELAPEVLEERGLGVAPLLRRHAVVGGGLCDLLAVLVHAGQELDVIACRAAEARLDVREQGAVGGAQVRGGVDVVDGGGDEVGRLLCHMTTPHDGMWHAGSIVLFAGPHVLLATHGARACQPPCPAYVNRGPAYTARDKTSSSPGASTFSNDAAENPGASRVSR